MLARAYLRASTSEQDATRARNQVEAFAAERVLRIAGFYVENVSGASLARPELFRLLAELRPMRCLACRAGRPCEPAIGSRLEAAAKRTRRSPNPSCRARPADILDDGRNPMNKFTARMFGAVKTP